MTPEDLQHLRDRGVRLATAESCTGGMVGAALTELAGSSDIYMGGVVTYSNAAKMALLDVRADTLADHGAVSEPVAAQMAQGALAAVPEASMAVSVTGIAGPGGSDAKPEGMVCFGLALGGQIHTFTQHFGPLGRAHVRAAARDFAVQLCLKHA